MFLPMDLKELMMKVIKRNGVEQEFDITKIQNALKKANASVKKEIQMQDTTFDAVMDSILARLKDFKTIDIESIQDFVESALVKHNQYEIAKNYITYRHDHLNARKFLPQEEQILSLIKGTNTALRGDNANKKIDINSSMRDYIAGVMCKSIATKILPKDIIEAHNKGIIHYHDLDYSPLMPMHNCDLLDIEDMLLNGFMMGDTKIDSPKSFSTACNLLAQINLIVSGSQYGGQTISWSALLPFVQRSREAIKKELMADFKALKVYVKERDFLKLVEKKVRLDIKKGVKTYQYQVICHQSSNGQTPFVSNNLCLREAQSKEELHDLALIIEEVLKRRIKGVKNEKGQWVSPLFPKLLYWTCEGLNLRGDPFFYLTELAAKCISGQKRMQPDILSEKKCREIAQNQIIPVMGCRSKLAPIWEEVEYSTKDSLNYEFNADNSVDYLCFSLEKKPLSAIKNGNYTYEYPVNFRGNTGWVIYKDNHKVIVKKPIVYGRWNEGVITLNLPYIALLSKGDKNEFFTLLEKNLQLCKKALSTRHKSICEIKAKNSPILWMYGGLARLNAEDSIKDLLEKYPKRPSISLGYVGLYEVTQALISESNTTQNGQKLCKEILEFLNLKCQEWKEEDGLNYSLYGTPEESLTWKFAKANQRDFGIIKNITDKDYVVNSYHINPKEKIDAFLKLKIEGEYLSLSSGGAVSYIETGDLSKNLEAVLEVINFMHHNIFYAEINTKSDSCYQCGFQGEITLKVANNGEYKFQCPNCGNDDSEHSMSIIRRICGYLGQVNAKNTNQGRLDDIHSRVVHL